MIFGYALGVAPTDLAGTALQTAVQARTTGLIKKHITKGTLTAIQNLGHRLGFHILQRTIKYAVPIASVAAATIYNRDQASQVSPSCMIGSDLLFFVSSLRLPARCAILLYFIGTGLRPQTLLFSRRIVYGAFLTLAERSGRNQATTFVDRVVFVGFLEQVAHYDSFVLSG